MVKITYDEIEARAEERSRAGDEVFEVSPEELKVIRLRGKSGAPEYLTPRDAPHTFKGMALKTGPSK